MLPEWVGPGPGRRASSRVPASIERTWRPDRRRRRGRDADELLATLDAARRDIMVITLAAGLLLAGMLFLIFDPPSHGSAASTSS